MSIQGQREVGNIRQGACCVKSRMWDRCMGLRSVTEAKSTALARTPSDLVEFVRFAECRPVTSDRKSSSENSS
jgi:hypothetical protein